MNEARASSDVILGSILCVLGLAFGAFSWRRRALDEGPHAGIEEAARDDEVLLRSVLLRGSDIFTILEADGTIRYESPSVEWVLGYKPGELIGKVAFDYVHPEDLERVLDAFAGAPAEPETARRVEYRFRQADGSWRYLESIGNNLLESPGVRGIFLVSRDVSERKMVEDSLRQSEERYRAVVEQSLDGIYLVDADTRRILETNPSLQRMLGYSVEEFRGMELYELIVHPREDMDSNLERTLEEKQRFIGERRYRRKDGSLIDVEVGVNTTSFGGKEVFCVFVRDVTARKQAELKVREAEARFQTLVEHLPAAVYAEELSGDGKVLKYMSPRYEAMLGYSPEEGVSNPDQWLKTIHPEDVERVMAEDRRTDETLEPFRMEYRVCTRDGQVLWMKDERCEAPRRGCARSSRAWVRVYSLRTRTTSSSTRTPA